MDNEDLINKLKIYEEENTKLKEQLDKYKNLHKPYYEKNKEIVNEKAKERLKKIRKEDPDKLKEINRKAYLKRKDRKIHSILTYQMENNRKGCINRDKNGCRNIQKVFNSYMLTGERPEKYRREYKFQ